MCDGRLKRLPDGWNIHLYDYLKKAPLTSWIWEFSRRSVLLEVNENSRLHLYNQNSLFEETTNRLLVEESRLFEVYDESLFPFFLNAENYVRVFGEMEIPPAVLFTHNIEMAYSKQPLIIFDHIYDQVPTLEISIDFTRKDSTIVEDFKNQLSLFRREFPRPAKILPRLSKWYKSKCLPVWDLRNAGVTWKCISDKVFKAGDDYERARNAYATAKKFIDQKKYYDLLSSI